MNARTLDRPLRARQALRFTLAVLAVAVSGAFVLFGGCVLPTQGIPNPDGGGVGGGTTTCNDASDCDDDNPCTKDVCGSDKICQHTPQADGDAPAADQPVGNCKVIVCTAGHPKDENDATNLPTPPDDCETPVCTDGAPSFTDKTDGSPCTATGDNPGVCRMGMCKVQCSATVPCPSMGSCQTASCDAATGVCVYTNLPDGTPTGTQDKGSCQDNECIGGQPMMEEDDSNVPVTKNDCVTPTCTAGAPSTPSKSEDTVCATLNGSTTGVCDGNGKCVECNHDGQCAGTSPDNDCQHPVCTANKCVPSFIASGTPTSMNPPQVPGDCQQIQCDGNGGTMNAYDMSDPAPTGNPCMVGTCTGPNMTTDSNVANGTGCGATGTLSCLNGVCMGCTMPDQCGAAVCTGNTLTKQQTCMAGACGNPAPATQDCDPYLCTTGPMGTGACTTKCSADTDCIQSGVGNYCAGGPNGTCKAKEPQGGACTAGDQCQAGLSCADGFCCNTPCSGTCLACSMALTGAANGTCSAVTTGTDPKNQCTMTMASTCGTDGLCSGAACALYAGGTQCKAASCNGTMLTFAETCNGTGTCNAPNPTTTDCFPNKCNGTACATSCMHDTDCAAGAYCNGTMCLAKQANGASCTMADQCSSGFCADGFCCNVACTGACDACAVMLQQPGGGGTGTCSPSVNGMASPTGHAACTMTAQSSCGTDGTCQAGACHDWSSSTTCAAATCMAGSQTTAKNCDGNGSCDQGGTVTGCGAYTCAGTTCGMSCTGNGMCAAGFACSGAMTCLPTTGTACTQPTQCASGFCADGFCCNVACTGACEACATSLQQSGGGGNGMCSPSTNGSASPAGHTTCTASSQSSCGLDGDCHNGACEDWSSGTTCAAATCAPGSGGTASMVTAAMTCSGGGMCNGGGAMSSCTPNANCSGTMCGTTCAGPTDCVTGFFCVSGTCQKQTNGGMCSVNSDCSSTHCIMGTCCSQGSCTGTCLVGTCSSGTTCDLEPPDYVCAPADQCNGAGNNTSHNLGVCDGTTMTCHMASVNCNPGTCTTMGCTSCTTDMQCPAYGWCSSNVCVAQGLTGATCAVGSMDQCVNGTCLAAGTCP